MSRNAQDRQREVQRSVYDWYEMNSNDREVVDIYSPEWEKRMTDWQDWLFQNGYSIAVSPDMIWKDLETPSQIYLPLFFFAYPIAGFCLLQILQACYDLDEAVCGKNRKEWKEMRPFEYLENQGVRDTWRKELEHLKKSMEKMMTGEVQLIINTILSGLDRLQTLVGSAARNFQDVEPKVRDMMLGRIQDMLEQRSYVITDTLTG